MLLVARWKWDIAVFLVFFVLDRLNTRKLTISSIILLITLIDLRILRNIIFVWNVFLYRLDLVFKEVVCSEIIEVAPTLNNLLVLFLKFISGLIILIHILNWALILQTLHPRTIFGQYSFKGVQIAIDVRELDLDLLLYGSVNQSHNVVLEGLLSYLFEAAIKPTLDNLLLDFICYELRIRKHKGSLKKFEEVVFNIFEVGFYVASYFLVVFCLLGNFTIFIKLFNDIHEFGSLALIFARFEINFVYSL